MHEIGTFELTETLKPKANMTIKGVSSTKTILTSVSSWQPGTDTLPDGEIYKDTIISDAYLIYAGSKNDYISIHDLTLTGPNLHGGIFVSSNNFFEVYNVVFDNFLWTGFRSFVMKRAKVHDNVFVDAGERQGPVTPGALFLTYSEDCEFFNNHIYTTDGDLILYGFKGRQGKRCRFHHNTVEVNFSFEYPLENDENIEIDHNMFTGIISIPKYAGGSVRENGYSFHIHHNLLQRSYALEWSRNQAEVDHNLFQFTLYDDDGNLFTDNGEVPSPGWTIFHNNYVKNPGRGIYWAKDTAIYSNITFRNNHIVANPTVTPRTEGLFGFPPDNDFSTIKIVDNIIEIENQERPLMRNTASYSAIIENNKLIGISDTENYQNPTTGNPQGGIDDLCFTCGKNSEYTVKGFDSYHQPEDCICPPCSNEDNEEEIMDMPDSEADETKDIETSSLSGSSDDVDSNNSVCLLTGFLYVVVALYV
eukprot:TRINITY_DN3148_c0_g1_i2.p1 TRINITY_DN3148_c0_g1~~TRINITY_DN3148_c0_g1_i2.p1  ORF type:complete len:476 (+),score=83.48 TRINITY_DN3148_c0_g1_i2:361-1788(+)